MARLLIAALIIVAGTVVAPPAGGMAQQTGVAATINQGNCEAVGDVVAPLVEARLPQGAPRGNAAALAAASSFTTVPVSLEALAASDHAIVVPFPVGEEFVACGEIGGALTEAGALIVGLGSGGDLRISGIAYLSPSADPTQTDVSLFVTGEGLDTFLASAFLPPTVAEEDAARFAEALAARADSPRLAGPFAGQLVQREGLRIVYGAGITAADFAATATFTNPTEQTETPWDVGFAFHGTQETARVIAVASDGGWLYNDPSTGTLGAGPSTAFDAAPGATNTLDLVVEGSTALFGVNGELAIRLDLPPPTASDVLVGTGLFSGNAAEGREIVYTDFQVWGLPGTTGPTAAPSSAAEDDAARFAAALAARGGTKSLAGPLGGVFHQSQRGLAASPAGLTTADFSATVTFVNPADSSGVPWDMGFAFHQNPEPYSIQEVYLDSNGLWYYTDFPNGVQQSGVVPEFDASPGGTNTLDLVVEGTTALFGVNGEFLARVDLPPPTASDVMAATDFSIGNLVEGREIIFSTFEVWEAPDLASLTTMPRAAAPDDASLFAVALAAREAASALWGPFADTLVQRQGSLALWGSETTPEDFSATVTFVNPTEQTGTAWDAGFAFHRIAAIFVDAEGFWYFGGTRAGFVLAFDGSPGATNTLDLVVDGQTALFGVNGEFVASLDLAPATRFEVLVGTGFVADHVIAGREIAFRDFQVWS